MSIKQIRSSFWAGMLFFMMATPVDYVSTDVAKYCYADEDNPYSYFGITTSYDYIRQNSTYRSITPECVPIKLWMFGRHGTRYPGKNEMNDMKITTSLRDKIVQHYEQKLGNICEKDIQNFKNWVHNLTADLDHDLTSRGQKEINDHAVRMKKSFPSLLNRSFSTDIFEFQSTSEKRAIESAVAFANGLFFSDASFRGLTPSRNDALLHTENVCKKWLKLMSDPRTFYEQESFKNGSQMKEVIFRVSRRLGFHENLTFSELFAMYEICSYETTWYFSSKSPFCAPFTAEDLKILEFLDDLRYYYRNGYGNKEINVNIGCFLVKDMFQRLGVLNEDGSSQTNLYPPVTIYFSHMGPLLQFLTALGIKNDNRSLFHHNFEDLENRKWRTSKMVPFGSNFVAILYRCENNSRMKDNMVAFYLNEDVLSIPGCTNGLCSLDYLLTRYKSVIDPYACNLDHCNESSSSSRLRLSQFSISLTLSFFTSIIMTIRHFIADYRY